MTPLPRPPSAPASPPSPASPVALPPRPPARPTTRALARALPGVREVVAQIERHGDEWATRTLAAIDAGGPLFVALGDSTAVGIGAADLDGGYVPKVFARRPPELSELQLVNLAVSGARVGDLRRHQLPLFVALRERVQVVTCSIGSNDLLRSPNAVRLTRELREVFDVLQGEAPVAVATLPVSPVSISGRIVNATIRREATARALRVADLGRQRSVRGREALGADRFHPSARGYDDWAAAFVEALGW